MKRAASTNLIRARNMGVKRGGRWIFRHVDLNVEQGEMIFVIGASGAGKTTCVKASLGLIRIDEGSVEQADSLRIGYVPQRLPISPTLPLSARRLMTLTGRFSRERIDAALAAVGLDKLGDPQVTTLSGGEFQRLLLARALTHRPELLVLDEPEQGVDMAGAQVLFGLIDEIRRDLGCGVLVISHDLKRAVRRSDDIVVLVPHEHDAESAADGEPVPSPGPSGRTFQG